LFARGKKIRDEVVVCSTCYVTQPDFCEMPFEEVVQSLPGLGRIDIATAGGCYWHDFWARLPIYQRHKRDRFAGVRAIGGSFHDRTLALTAASTALVDVGFIRYNAGHPGARGDLFPHLPPKRSTLLFNFKSTDAYVSHERLAQLGLAESNWHPHLTDHYRFALSRPEVDGVLCSLASEQQVTDLADALARGPLTEGEQDYVMTLSSADRPRSARVDY
jgi:hypothetical protein